MSILIGIFFLAIIGFGLLESTLALMNKVLLISGPVLRELPTKAALKTTERGNFLIFAYVGLVLLVTQGLVYRRLVARVGEVIFLRLGSVLMIIGMVCVIVIALSVDTNWFGSREAMWVAALCVLTILDAGFALMNPSVQALISKRSDPARQGEILGINQSASALGRILGPMIGLELFFVGPAHILPYVLGTVLLGVVCLLTLRIHAERA